MHILPAIVNSSGTRKSRMVDGLSKKNIIVTYVPACALNTLGSALQISQGSIRDTLDPYRQKFV